MSNFYVIVVFCLLEASVVIVYPESLIEKDRKKTCFLFFPKKPLVARVGGEKMLEVFGVGGRQGI